MISEDTEDVMHELNQSANTNLGSAKLPPGVEHQHQQDCDIIAWSNRDIPINKASFIAFLLGFLLAIFGALYFTYQIFSGVLIGWTFTEQLVTIVCFLLVWLLVVGVSKALASLTWLEAIKITDEAIVITHSGRGAPKTKGFTKKIVLELAFGSAPDDESVDPSLSIVYGERWANRPLKREDLAFWMRVKEKQELFLLLQQILIERGWDNIRYVNTSPFGGYRRFHSDSHQ